MDSVSLPSTFSAFLCMLSPSGEIHFVFISKCVEWEEEGGREENFKRGTEKGKRTEREQREWLKLAS